MAPIKTIERSATVGFCPTPAGKSLLAAGTVAGAIDMSFSTNAVLEIFSLDLASGAEAPAVAGSIPVPERFNRLAWGAAPSDATRMPLGIIAGGLADGSVCLWNPADIVHASAGKAPLLAKMQKHGGPVKGLEFNTFSPNLLASGASDGELCIWDVANPAQPSLYPGLKSGAQPGAAPVEITYLSWNRKVQHILASTQVDGATVIWDLKKQRPVITLKDPNSQRRCSVLQWNPEVATQLVVASDDDRSPTLQLWDLRNSMGPVKEFVGHTKGVLGMAWCSQDPGLLLSCSKDHRTICWEVSTTDVLCELPASGNWDFDVQWSPQLPGVFSTSSFDGKVAVHNVLACTGGGMVETINADFSTSKVPSGATKPLKRAPAWMGRPCGAAFGFGGRLVSFSHAKQQVTDPATGQVRAVDTATLALTQVVTEASLVQHSEAFEQSIAHGDRAALRDFCSHKAAGAKSTEESETWTFMGVLFEEDARRQLLQKLGFADALAAAQQQRGSVAAARTSSAGVAAAAEHLANAVEQIGLGDGTRSADLGAPADADFFNQADNPEGFFDNLPDAPTPTASATPATAEALRRASANGGPPPSEPATPVADAGAAAEGEEDIQKALFVGNYEGAVELCFKANRLADALLIANIGGADVFKRAMHRYMRRSPRPYMTILTSMVEGDYAMLVKTRPVGQWKETLAVLATYTGPDQWASLCDALAARLAQTGMHHAASLCYVCAGNVDQAVLYWSKAVKAEGAKGAVPVDTLQSVIEKSVVLGLATNNSAGASPALADLVTQYASILSTQGRMEAALRYLAMVPGEASTSVAVLRDRIYRSGAPGAAAAPVPPFPFQLEDVRPSAQPTSPVSAAAASHQAFGAHAGGYGAAAAQQQQHAGYGAPAAVSQQQSPYGSGAYGGYGAAAAAGGYGQQQQQQQQSGYGAAAAGYGAAAQSAYGQSAAAAGGYGQPAAAAGGYGQPAAAAGGYGGGYGGAAAGGGGYAPAAPQEPVYQPKRAGAPAAPAPPAAAAPGGGYGAPAAQQPSTPTSYGQPAAAAGGYGAPAAGYGQPAAAAAAAPPAAAPAPGMFVPQPVSQQQPAAARPAGQTVQPTAFFSPTASTTIAQPAAPSSTGRPGAPPAHGAPYGAPAAPGYGAPAAPGGYGAPPGAPPPAAAAPPQPTGPPAHINMQSADVSKVSAEHKPILASLNNLFNACMPLANNPARKREMEDNSKRLGALFWKLNEHQVSPHVAAKLLQLCGALDAGNWPAAAQVQVELTTSDWDECGTWLTALKRLIKVRQMAG